MSPPSRSNPKPLPPPTPSEAAFERLLASFDDAASASAHERDRHRDTGRNRDTVVDRLYAQSKTFLERDPFAGIGDREVFPTKVMGVSFEGRQDLLAGLRPGLELDLHRQPDNPKDSQAIAVFYGALQLGFLRKEIAKHLAPLIDGGVRYRARIEHLTGGSEKLRGVNIRVERERSPLPHAFTAPDRAGDRAAIVRALIGDAQPRDEQHAVLSRLDAGKNTLAVFGTGRGKSFCFQYPAAYRALESGQKTLVLYPLRALANDQHDALVRRLDGFGLRIFRANGSIDADERAQLVEALESGNWDVILATPEFLEYHCDAFAANSAPSFVVVDEAHHTHESKHRSAYGQLARTLARLGKPQLLALTATAGDDAFRQVCKSLSIDAWVIDPTVRDNLRVVDARGSKDKIGYLRRVLDGAGKSIVYCNSRTEATRVAQGLRKAFGNDVAFYHAGMPSSDRGEVEALFRAGELAIVVATSAFGEGIDLPDVRNVALYHLNFNFTEFNQQAGRAGRDGKPAHIHLLFDDNDRALNEFLIECESPQVPVLRELYKGLRGLASSGVVRLSNADIARTLDVDRVRDRTIATAVRIFADEGLLETGIDDEGRFLRFRDVNGKVDLTKNERYAEGEAERESFAQFCEMALKTDAKTLERIINRPIYPGNVELRK